MSQSRWSQTREGSSVPMGGIRLACLLLACGPSLALAAGRHGYARDIAPYVSFLRGQSQASVDYIVGLFDAHDVVIVCERDHRESTQYQLIGRLIRHPSFVERVGHVFVEVGSESEERRIDDFLTAQDLPRQAVEERLLEIYRNLTWFPLWEKTNFGDFLRGVYRFNRWVPLARKIHVHPVDVSFDWALGTPDTYQTFMNSEVEVRDQRMAQHVLRGLRRLAVVDPRRRKALVIMNYRHAFNDRFTIRGQRRDNVGRFLFEALPGRVANVLVNTLAPRPDAGDHVVSTTTIQQGKWDAAFAVIGDRDLGFSFAGSPFGHDRFDLFPFAPNDHRYQEIFTGMVFYKAIGAHRIRLGVPGLFDDAFKKEYQRRSRIAGGPVSDEHVARLARLMDTVREGPYEELERHQRDIKRWLR